MSALHVVVRPRPEHAPDQALASLYGLVDVVVDGVNITARLGEGQALALLGELAATASQLAAGTKRRASVQMYADNEVWEIALEACDRDALMSVFRPAPPASVAVFERRIALGALVDALADATSQALGRRGKRLRHPHATSERTTRASLLAARGMLEATPRNLRHPIATRTERRLCTQTERLALEVVARLRSEPASPSEASPQVERADLHGLLSDGHVQLRLGERTLSAPCVPILLVEQSCQLAKELSDPSRKPRALVRKLRLGALQLELKRAPNQEELDVRASCAAVPSQGSRQASSRIDSSDFCRVLIDLARQFSTAVIDCDPLQRHNLRLRALSETLDQIDDQLLDAHADDSLTNPAPEGYRCFAPAQRRPKSFNHQGSMRYAARWVATVPGIDLRSTFLCGDRLVVGSSRETACIARQTGQVLWQIDSTPAAAVVAPSGLVRIEPSGKVAVHDLADGQRRFSVRVTPRSHGAPAGSVVHTPGLPQLLTLAEGDRQIAAIDLVSGDIRWRYTASRRSKFKLRRMGRLLLVAGDSPTLVALDVTTGEVVWRLRERLHFSGDVAFDRDSVFALSGARGAGWQLHHIDPWTGQRRWSVELGEQPLSGQPPLVTADSVVVPVQDPEGCGLKAFRRRDGHQLWEHSPGLVSRTTAWLVLDDSIVANSDTGVLLCIAGDTGRLRYNHVFSRNVEADKPRRLEPVLRSGALFVPQHEVHVIRPQDGDILGTIPTDLIPDLIRVDERCDVYVAEESGHLAAFAAGPRLSLVK